MPAGSPAAGSERALAVWLLKVRDSLDNIGIDSVGLMAKNLVRFITWQNPLTPALAVLGILPALRLRGPMRAMTLGVLLNLAVVAVIMPYQGHGWGYRYLHGFLGSICLLAAFAWMRLRESLDAEAATAARHGVVLVTLFSLFVLTPWRGIQANAFVTPYAEAGKAIAAAGDADVVIVDTTGLFYAVDLVRNDPFLRNTPKVLDLSAMRESDIRAVCSRNQVAIFDRTSGSRLRFAQYDRKSLDRLADGRRLMRSLGCGTNQVTVK
jgi:hypothetical protein